MRGHIYVVHGSWDVTVVGCGNKSQVTTSLLTCTAFDVFPMQIIFEGEISCSLSRGKEAQCCSFCGWNMALIFALILEPSNIHAIVC